MQRQREEREKERGETERERARAERDAPFCWVVVGRERERKRTETDASFCWVVVGRVVEREREKCRDRERRERERRDRERESESRERERAERETHPFAGSWLAKRERERCTLLLGRGWSRERERETHPLAGSWLVERETDRQTQECRDRERERRTLLLGRGWPGGCPLLLEAALLLDETEAAEGGACGRAPFSGPVCKHRTRASSNDSKLMISIISIPCTFSSQNAISEESCPLSETFWL